MNLHGTIALVTGGAKRVGRAIVHELAAAGCDTAIHCLRSRKEADALASDIAASGRRAVVVAGDLNDPATWPR
ncbi:MAG: SDR family NAD(P)-dependent oxidoreductase, partial [Phycisphaerae bacterium]